MCMYMYTPARNAVNVMFVSTCLINLPRALTSHWIIKMIKIIIHRSFLINIGTIIIGLD